MRFLALRTWLLCALVALSACKSSRPAGQPPAPTVAVPAPPPGAVPAPAPAPGGVTISSGSKSGASLTGIANRQGNEVVVTTTDATLPPVGASGPLFWIVDRPIPVFGQGVQLQLANVQVKAAQAGSVTLTIVSEAGPITLNGARVNVFHPNAKVKLDY